MTTTVTTTTVTTVTAMGLTITMGVIASVALIAFLVMKEVASSAPGERTIRWSKTLNIGIAPLLLAFAMIVAANVAQAL